MIPAYKLPLFGSQCEEINFWRSTNVQCPNYVVGKPRDPSVCIGGFSVFVYHLTDGDLATRMNEFVDGITELLKEAQHSSFVLNCDNILTRVGERCEQT